MWHMMGSGWMHPLGWIIMLAPVLLILWLLFSRTRVSEYHQPTSRTEDPLEILKVRYAKGEITREEYERMREELRQ